MRPDQDSVLESLYRTHFHEIEIHAFRYLGKWDDAHVAAQETFHIACEKIDDLMKQPNRIAWLKNIAKNVCRNMYRARKKQLSLFVSLDSLEGIHEPGQSDDVFDPLDTYKGTISDSEIMLLRKIILEGMSYLDAANELGIGMWACRKRVERALNKIRKSKNCVNNKE